MKIAHATFIAVTLAAPLAFSNRGPVAFAPGLPTIAAPASCDSLASLSLPHATITATHAVAEGAFVPPASGVREGAAGRGAGGRGAAVSPFANTPAFCRVSATLTPSGDSDIKAEVWLPASGWNGKYQAVGGGGWAGVISYPAMAAALAAVK